MTINNFFQNAGNSSSAVDRLVFKDVSIDLSEILELFKNDGAQVNIEGYSYSKTEDDKGNTIAVNFELL